MPTISILPQHLVNKIAAGEVVERPASVVKELMENSLDAGARQIDVEIDQGGRELIRISDDGCGMDAEDLALAFTPHATSKISSDDDLFNIHTLGFRGEALPSIASVSQLRAVSRPRAAIEGASVTIEGGHAQPVMPAAAPVGTMIEVRNLFYNVPARRKFLRTPNTEMGHISEQFIRIALPNSDMQFSLTHNGRKNQHLTAGQSLRERISMLFTAELADSLMSVQRDDRGVQITGLVAPPQHSRAGSQYQYVFLNGRYIRDRFIGHAVREAYRGLIEHSRQPVVFLFLSIDPNRVDVNVHPAKTEVRFADANMIHSQVLAAIRDRLLSTDLSATFEIPKQTEPAAPEAADESSSAADETQPDPAARQQQIRQAMADFFKDRGDSLSRKPTPPAATKPSSATAPSAGRNRFTSADLPGFGAKPVEQAEPLPAPAAEPNAQEPATAPAPQAREPEPASGESKIEPAPPSVLQLHNTYLVVETEEGMLIIDQHALHERILYEKLWQHVQQGPLPCQRRLIPETFDATAAQMDALDDCQTFLADLGIIVESFGPQTLAVHGLPTLLDKADPISLVTDILDLYRAQSGKIGREELLHHILDMMACKAAIKAGDPLSDQEIRDLIQQRPIVERSSNCPHGRPTAIRMSLAQLEKQFKRT